MTLLRTTTLLGAAVSTLTLMVGTTFAGDVTWWTPNWGADRAKELVSKFEAANPGIKIRTEITTSDGLPQRVLTALQSGAAPDIIEVQHGWVNGYAQANLVLPLDDTIQEKADFVKGAIDYVTWDNKLWAIPYRIETHGIIYNLDEFKAAGLDPANPPQTWTDFKAAAAKLTNGKGQFGFAITGGGEMGNTIFRSLPFIWMNGGDIISADQTKAVVNSSEAIAAVQFYTDFFKNKQSPDSTLQNDGLANRKLFDTGAVAMYQSGQFDVPAIKKESNGKINVGVMPIPHPEGKNTAAVLGGWSYVIPKDAKNPTDAKKFLQFLNTSENQAFFTDTFPARTSAMSAPRFSDPILSEFKKMLPFGRATPANKHWVQITQAYFDGIQRILLGDQDVKTSMDQANEEIQGLLDS
jgi:multiple sugar transport system substrate-binding protein